MIYKDKSCRSSLVPLDKSEGSVKGTLLLSGVMSTAALPEKVEDQGPGISR